jgi:DNA-binding LytR/AlgR family response regulator
MPFMPHAEITILAVEDDPTQARILRHQLQELGYVLAGIARTAEEAEALFVELAPDLVLLDVHLAGDRDGIDTAESLIRHRAVPLIFVTAFPDSPTFARARLVGPFAFLGKPYNGPLLGHSIELALQHFATAHGQPPDGITGDFADGTVLLGGIFVRDRGRFVKVPFAELLVVEADQGYIHLYTATHKFTLRQALAELASRLPSEQFQQIHRSFVVKLVAITAYDPRTSTVQVGEHTIPIGRVYRDDLTGRLGPMA